MIKEHPPLRTMRRAISRTALLPLVLVLGCIPGGGDPAAEEERRDDGPLGQLQRFGEAAEQMAESAEEVQRNQEEGRPPAEPVDFRRLQELLPEQAVGLPRTDRRGERSGAMGMTVSNATAQYQGEPDAEGTYPTLELKVTDFGGVAMATMIGAAWTLASIDRESDTEFERTTTIGGHPAYIKYNHQDRSGNYQQWIAERFLVEANGRGLSEEQMRQALASVDARQLVAMRDEGR
jgi:hypothetical protein